jgi:rhodanese-related sulfurtransferase
MTTSEVRAGAGATRQVEPRERFPGSLVRRFPHACRAALLVALALAAAAVCNALIPLGIRWTPSPDGRVGIPRAFEQRLREIAAPEALKMLQAGDAIFVDSRDEKDYKEGHIPDAINFPMRQWARLEAGATRRLPRDAKLVLYCYGGACGLSTRMGKRLLELDYQHPIVLRRGWAEWTEAGYPATQNTHGKPQ